MGDEKDMLANFKRSITEMSTQELQETLTAVRTSREKEPQKVAPKAKGPKKVKELSEETKTAMNSLDLGAL